jgi:acyl carrier protein
MLSKNDLKKIIEDTGLKIDFDTIATDASLISVGIDSLDFFNILMGVEKVCGKTLPDEDIDKVNSIDDILEYFS